MGELPDRFWSKVDRGGPEDCWIWQASTKQSGHGQIRVGASPEYAHRVAFKLKVKDPGDKDVLHKCGNPACVNPSHLYLGDQADNLADASNRGRLPTGKNNAAAKLTEGDVLEIRNAYGPNKSMRSLADEYDVSPGTIHSIIHHKTWSDV